MSSQVLTKQQDFALDSWIRLIRGYASATRAMSAELVVEHGLTINDYEALLHLSKAEEGRMAFEERPEVLETRKVMQLQVEERLQKLLDHNRQKLKESTKLLRQQRLRYRKQRPLPPPNES